MPEEKKYKTPNTKNCGVNKETGLRHQLPPNPKGRGSTLNKRTVGAELREHLNSHIKDPDKVETEGIDAILTSKIQDIVNTGEYNGETLTFKEFWMVVKELNPYLYMKKPIENIVNSDIELKQMELVVSSVDTRGNKLDYDDLSNALPAPDEVNDEDDENNGQDGNMDKELPVNP